MLWHYQAICGSGWCISGKGFIVTMGSKAGNKFLTWAADEHNTLKLTWTSNQPIWVDHSPCHLRNWLHLNNWLKNSWTKVILFQLEPAPGIAPYSWLKNHTGRNSTSSKIWRELILLLKNGTFTTWFTLTYYDSQEVELNYYWFKGLFFKYSFAPRRHITICFL